jgi:hypothetical protein
VNQHSVVFHDRSLCRALDLRVLFAEIFVKRRTDSDLSIDTLWGNIIKNNELGSRKVKDIVSALHIMTGGKEK